MKKEDVRIGQIVKCEMLDKGKNLYKIIHTFEHNKSLICAICPFFDEKLCVNVTSDDIELVELAISMDKVHTFFADKCNHISFDVDLDKPIQQKVAVYCLAIVERFLKENTDCHLSYENSSTYNDKGEIVNTIDFLIIRKRNDEILRVKL